MRFNSTVRLWINAAVLIAIVALFPFQLPAQAVSGDLVGTVSDSTGGVIANVSVTATNSQTGVRTATTTGADGAFRFTNLPVGTYTITATATGFAKATVEEVLLQLNNVVTQNVTLAVGEIATTVEVTAAPPPLDTTTAQVQATYATREIEELPSASFGRTAGLAGTWNSSPIWNLSLLGAGVSSQGGVGQGVGPAIAGQRPENNSFYLDGVGNNNHYTTGPLAVVGNDAVAEVSILKNQFSAEFGGASGGVFNAIVKSGTNQLHGSIFEYLQNRNLNAVDALQWTQGLTSPPRFDSNRLGATIGGPIIKNKLFYFGDFEYNPIGQSSAPGSPLNAPTAAGLSALANIPGISKTNLGVFTKYVPVAPSNDQGTIQAGNVSVPIGSIPITSPNFDNSYNAVASIDYNLSDRDQLRGRYIFNRLTGIDPSAQLPVFFQSSPNNSQFGSISEFHSFGPTLQNEFRSSFNRNYQSTQAGNFSFPGLGAFPNLTIDDLNSLQIGPDPNTPSGLIQNLLQLQDNLSKVAGRHTLKFGYSFTDIILTNYFVQRVRGDYEYNTLAQYLFDLTPDVFGERSAGPNADPLGFLENSAFASDDFRIRPNLTVNLGVRYEYVTTPVASRTQIYSAPANVPGGITFGRPYFSPNDWSPRVGFAYSPGKNQMWVIRGGFSRSFALDYGNLAANTVPAFFQTTQDVNLASNAPNFLANGGLNGGGGTLPTDPQQARAIISTYTFGGQRPYALTWTLGVERLLGKNYTLEARYIGTKGVHLWDQTRLNIAPQVSPSNYIPTFFTMPSPETLASLTKTYAQVKSYIVPGGTASRPFNQFASLGFNQSILAYAPQANSSYNGLALQITRRYSNGLSYIAAYTWSHLLDDATATNFSTQLSPRRAQDFQNLRAEWASSALDRRHRFTLSPVYDWRPFSGRGWLMKDLAGNWTLSGTYTFESPEYATVQSGIDSNLNNDSLDRSIINPAGAANAGSDVIPYNAKGQQSGTAASPGSDVVAFVAKNPNARYVKAGLGALPNAGRNTFPLKRINNVDLGVTKRLNVTERWRLSLGGQFFNLFNHAQYTGGYLSDVSGLGYIGSRNDLVPGNALFGRFDQFYSSNSRQIQVFGKINF
ncbi:MAG: carboxypeptidase regulatory-like domain-containing protein [Acidobacteriia bacterium]|nr:carboxypeptidase regulatory-like domain-containing protein [Terriglobia bacterium]